jgi:hypothetical protein
MRPLDWIKRGPLLAEAASDRLGWVGLEAARYSAESASELHPPALTSSLSPGRRRNWTSGMKE